MRLARIQTLDRRGVSLDTETWKFTPDTPVPKLVLGSAGWLEPGPRIAGALLDKDTVLEVFAQAIDDPDAVLIGANISMFDLLVIAVEFERRGVDIMPYILLLLEQGRVLDILTVEVLNAIAEGTLGKDPRTGGEIKNPDTGRRGSYSLATVVDLVLGRPDAKANDQYRLRYAEFDNVALDQLPPAARDYPIDDAKNSAEVALAQTGHLPKISSQHDWGVVDGRSVCVSCGASKFATQCLVRRPHKNLHEVANQVYSSFCLHLGDVWGLRVDQSKVDLIEAHAIRERAAHIAPFIAAGIIRENGSENQSVIKRMVAEAYGATESCPVCSGTGEVPHPEQPTLRCPDCKGRCQPWKSGGTVKPPTVATCATCSNTGRVPHHIVKMKGCEGPLDAKGKPAKTCCGTGLILPEDVPRSDGGDVSFGRDSCHESGHEFLMSFGDFKEDAKVLKDYIPYLRTARVCIGCGHTGVKKDPHAESCPGLTGTTPGWLDINLTLKSNAILETGRVSYRGYIQLFPRAPGFIVNDPSSPFHGQYIPSLRECFVARGPTYEYVQVPTNYQLQPGEFVVQGASA